MDDTDASQSLSPASQSLSSALRSPLPASQSLSPPPQSFSLASRSFSAESEDLANVLEESLAIDDNASQNHEIQYFSPIVMLIVGQEQLVMTAHKEVLTKFNSFFATSLENGRAEEGTENVIKLPDEEPQNIRQILSFLYGADPWSIPLSLTDVINRYILADKYRLEEMASCALNRAVSQTDGWSVESTFWSHFEQLKAAGLQGSMMWSTLMGAICTKLVPRNANFGNLDLESLLADGLESDSTAAIDLLREISTRVTQARIDRETAQANGWGNWN